MGGAYLFIVTYVPNVAADVIGRNLRRLDWTAQPQRHYRLGETGSDAAIQLRQQMDGLKILQRRRPALVS